jgi:hypothetical protein
MERVPRVLIALLMILYSSFASPEEAPRAATDTTAVMEKMFPWFDSLGYPCFQNRRFVNIRFQWSTQPADEPAALSTIHGFLLNDYGDRFEVLMLDLTLREFERPSDDAAPRRRATYEDGNFERVAGERLETLRETGDSLADLCRNFGNDMLERTQLFLLARACHAQGQPQLAHHALSQATAIPDWQTGKRLSIDDFQKEIANDISHAETWRCFVDFGNPLISREKLLRRFRWIAERFPENRHAERVHRTIEILSTMVEEDKTHATMNLPPLDEMPIKQRVAELIFQLRNQNGRQSFQPGSCDIFFDPRGPDSPAAQLVEIGKPALEQLIDAVDDDRFTRCVAYHRGFYFSHRVLRVGECCFAIMNRISPTGRVWNTEKDRERAKREMRVWFLGEPAMETGENGK